jgi:photosystem II stability/assembly factor-like uncharacterized protein
MKKFLFAVMMFSSVFAKSQSVSSATFGTLEARWLGPGTNSGRITAIDGVAEENGQIIYVGTAGGGVWKSLNAAVSFKPIFDKHCQSIGAIAIDQKNPKNVYVGTGESNMRNSVSIGDGFYKTTDAGDNWTRMGGLDSTEHISRIVIDPSNPNTLYVSAPGPLWSDSKHRGLYKSIDGGKTFEKILYINEKAGCADVSLDPKNPEVVYATTWEFRRLPYLFNSGGQGSAMWKSVDGGKTWKELKNGLPAKPFGRIAFTLAPSAPQNLLAIVESANTGLYISADGGETWKQQSATMNVVSRPFYFSTLVVDPFDAKRIYRPAYTFSYSVDGGYSFTDATTAVHADHHALWINPKNPSQLILGTDGGVYMSLDKGNNWKFLDNLPVGQFYHVATDKRTPYFVYGGLQDNGSWAAPSSAPGGVKNSDWLEFYGGDGFWVTPDPVDNNYVYAESQGGDVNRIDIKTFKSTSIRPQPGKGDEKHRWNWNTPIVTGSANPKNLYVGAQYLFRSTNKGQNWIKISPDLTTNDKKKQEQEKSGGLSADVTSAENHCTIFTIAESPLDENLIWVGTDDGNLQYSSDGGQTWSNVSKNVSTAGIPAQTWVSSIEPSRFDKNVVYASFDNHMYGDHKTYVARSSDLGKSWTMLKSDEFTGFAHKIREDLKNKDLLFLGTEMGLFGTIDGGVNWFRMKNNIPWYALVRDIAIHPVTNDLILATHGRGIMVVDDISPIRGLTPDILAKDVHFFDMKPMTLTTGMFGNGGTNSQGSWASGNAPSIPPFTYYLKDRVSSGELKLEIYDGTGQLLQTISGTNRKGINRLYWNQRIKGPKTAQGTKPDYGALVAPQVLPGTYTAKLRIGTKEFDQPLVLQHDANSAFTLADRELQYKTAMELYGMHLKLAKIVTDITDRQKVFKDSITKVTNVKAKKKLQDTYDKLETLRAQLVPTKPNSAFADEKRLREDISELYRAICGNETAPSNLQIEQVGILRQRVDDAEKTLMTIK